MPGSYQNSCSASSRRAPGRLSSSVVPRWPPVGNTESRRGAVAQAAGTRQKKSSVGRTTRIVGLGQKPFGDFAVLDELHRARAGHQRLLVIDAEQLINRGRIV